MAPLDDGVAVVAKPTSLEATLPRPTIAIHSACMNVSSKVGPNNKLRLCMKSFVLPHERSRVTNSNAIHSYGLTGWPMPFLYSARRFIRWLAPGSMLFRSKCVNAQWCVSRCVGRMLSVIVERFMKTSGKRDTTEGIGNQILIRIQSKETTRKKSRTGTRNWTCEWVQD